MRWPRVADRVDGQDEALPDCGRITPERVQGRHLAVSVFQPRKCSLVDPAMPGHFGQGESRRLARPLDLSHERAQLAVLAVEGDSRGTSAFLAGDVPDSR